MKPIGPIVTPGRLMLSIEKSLIEQGSHLIRVGIIRPEPWSKATEKYQQQKLQTKEKCRGDTRHLST